ncbi:uncharacterized protein LOC142380530 [Odontesthes bonariensis]|uniref:uncharacterized protein LOC142380530 n=1 Tax=Odontesthes bonariensis TaxID=219752 RepID=UPI003F5844EF
MDTEMRRSFPGFFKRKPRRSSVAFKSPKLSKVWKPFNFSVFLMHDNSLTTPSAEEDLLHMQAGLGKRTLTMDGDMTHSEVSSLFEGVFPKLKSISGGWLLYKAAGGNGRRHLSVVPPETEGYTGSSIKSASGGGKTMLYISPLQDKLDMAPLSTDAEEFSRMPKAECKNCKTVMPLQLLALHVAQCRKSECISGDDDDDDDDDDDLECISEAEQEICVTRQNLLQRVLLQWQRQQRGSPINQLKVTFIGEAGIDTGALRKEFLTEMVHGIELKMFEGDSKGKSPIYSVSDLESGFYRTAVEIFAVSLAQGGPPPCFLRSWCFDFISSGELNVTKADVDDVEYASLIERVEAADDVRDLTDEIINCGYTGSLTTNKKDGIIRAIVLHATLRLTPILQQLRSGLKIYDFLEVIERQPLICAPLFVPKQDDDDDTPDADYIMSIIVPDMSVKGSMRHTKETAILNFLQDFLQELQDTGLFVFFFIFIQPSTICCTGFLQGFEEFPAYTSL